MKRAGNLIGAIASPDNLRLAFWKAAKGKRYKAEVISYSAHLDKELMHLRSQLLNGKVSTGNYHYFTIYDPKERIICAASFPERVLHHALMNVCHDAFDLFQIEDSYATRRGLGTYAALNRASNFHKKNSYFLKMDVRKYFDSIDHEILKGLLRKRFKDHQLLMIFDKIIDSYHTKVGFGIPIGNLTSQYFANFYLAFADRYVKQGIGMKAYVRYMDDMVIWDKDKDRLKEVGNAFSDYLNINLKLELKIKYLNRSRHGLSFLGYRLYPEEWCLNKRSKIRYELKLRKYLKNFEEGIWDENDLESHLRPLLAFTEHANTKGFRMEVLNKIKDNCRGL